MTTATVQLEVRIKDLVRAELGKIQTEVKASSDRMARDLEGAGRGLKGIAKDSASAALGIRSLGSQILVAFGIGSVVNQVATAIQDYVKDLQQADRNIQILINRQDQYGVSSTELVARLREQADRLASAANPQSRQTTSSLAALAESLGLDNDKIIESIDLAKQLSDSYGVDAPKAMRAIALAMQGTKQGFDLLGEAVGRVVQNSRDAEKVFQLIPRQIERAALQKREASLSEQSQRLKGLVEAGVVGSPTDLREELKQTNTNLEYTRQLLRAVNEDIQRTQGQRLPKASELEAKAALESSEQLEAKLAQVANIARSQTPFADLPTKLKQIEADTQVELNSLVAAFEKARAELERTASLPGIDSGGVKANAAALGSLTGRFEEAQEALRERGRQRGQRLVEEDQRQKDAATQRDLEAQRREEEQRLRQAERAAAEERRVLEDAAEQQRRLDEERLQRSIAIGDLISDRIVDAWAEYRAGAISASQAVKLATESIIRDLARIAAKQAALAIVNAAFGGAQQSSTGGSGAGTGWGIFNRGDSGMVRTAGGWALGTPMSASRFHAAYGNTPTAFDGGGFLVNQPTRVGPTAVAGEAGMEAVIPLRRGKLVAEVVGGGGGATTIAPVFHIQAADTNGAEAVVARASKTVVSIIQEELARNRRFQEAVRNA